MAVFRFALCSLIAVGLTSCATSVPEPNLGQYKLKLTKWHESGEYKRAFAAAAQLGADYLARRVSEKKAGERIAVVFDIDETLLSNWGYLTERDFGITARSFSDWIARHDDPALAPTQAIYQAARRAGVPIFLITGRSEALRANTMRQLRAAGYSDWVQLYMRPLDYREPSVIPYKSGARQEISGKGYTIILNMGDQWSDLKGGFAEKAVKLPNPYYYIR